MYAEIMGVDGIVVIGVVALLLLLLGRARIPKLARGLGSASREFRAGQQGDPSGAPHTTEGLAPTGAEDGHPDDGPVKDGHPDDGPAKDAHPDAALGADDPSTS